MDMLVDKTDLRFGLGKRSWRYAMLVKDGLVQKVFIEPNEPGDPFEVSDADTMLEYVNPMAKRPAQVAVFTREGCQYCARAKALRAELGYDYAEVSLSHTNLSRVVGAVAGESNVPRVFIDGEQTGGLEALQQWAKSAQKAA
jgi:glutaredoxin